MYVWYCLQNIEYQISDFSFDSSNIMNYVAFRWKIVLNSFFCNSSMNILTSRCNFRSYGTGANALFNQSRWCRRASVLNFVLHLHPVFVYTSSEVSGRSSYTYAHARLSQHCSTLRQVPKYNGLALLINFFVTSKSTAVFCLIWNMHPVYKAYQQI